MLNEFAELRKKVKHTNPDTIELVALAGFLHTFYTGVENLFKRVEVQLDKKMSDGAFWHSQLLERMAQPSANHPPVISEKVRDMLRQYLNFRHVFVMPIPSNSSRQKWHLWYQLSCSLFP